MAQITLPVESGNQAVKDGSVSTIVQRLVERWKPEALYFGGFDGQRTVFVVYDMTDSSDVVAFGEPLFLELNARVMTAPVMTLEDLQNGFAKLG